MGRLTITFFKKLTKNKGLQIQYIPISRSSKQLPTSDKTTVINLVGLDMTDL